MHALLLMIPSHVSFISFLALKHLHKLAILAMRTHACREVVRVCTYSYVFQLCIVSSMLALSAHANTRISSSHAHTRAYAQALADAFLYISSLRNVCCSCLCMQVSLNAFGIQRSQAAVHPGCCSPGRKIGLPAVAGSTPQFAAFATSSRT